MGCNCWRIANLEHCTIAVGGAIGIAHHRAICAVVVPGKAADCVARGIGVTDIYTILLPLV